MNLWKRLTSRTSSGQLSPSVGGLRGAYVTDAGMLALWIPTAFQGVTDYDTWERELLDNDDIQRHIRLGAFVPININSDGCFEVEVRVGAVGNRSVINERERKFLFVTSEPYLLRSQSKVCLSGIEHVEREPSQQVGRLDLPPGDYSAVIHMIGWDEEPGSRTDDGKPTANALPYFLVILNPVVSETTFRTKVDTFDRPSQ